MKEMLDLAKVVQATAQEDDQKVSSLTKEEREKLQRAELDKQAMAVDEELIYCGLIESEVDDDDEMPEAAEEVETEGEQSVEVEEEQIHGTNVRAFPRLKCLASWWA